MSLGFQNLDELRNFIGREQPSRVKFATKLFHVLAFSRNHPASVQVLGASWCKDGVHFVCHSGILALFLGLKANSINTNFRDHGFGIVRFSIPEITREFPGVPSIHNWKKRANNRHTFTAFTPLADIERIPCGESANVGIVKHENLFHGPGNEIPLAVLTFVRQNTMVERRVFGIWDKIGGSPGPDLVTRAFMDWRRFAGDDLITEIEKFTSVLTKGLESESDTGRLRANAEILISDGFHELGVGMMDFASYFLFTLRYGFLDESLGVLLQVSDPEGFHPWFQPMLDRQSARLVLGCSPRNTWLVRVGELPGTFVLTYKHETSLLMTTITFDPIIPERRLSVDMGTGPIFTTDWPSLLYSVLRLNSRECLEFKGIGREVNVNGAKIAQLSANIEEPPGDLQVDSILAVPLPLTRRSSTRGVLT
jgi:hypothetical protein